MKTLALVFLRYRESLWNWNHLYFTNENLVTTLSSRNMEFFLFLKHISREQISTMKYREFCISCIKISVLILLHGSCCCYCCCCCIASVVPDLVRPNRGQPTRLHRPWDSPGQNTGLGCHFLLQCMNVQGESEITQSCPTLPDPMDCNRPGPHPWDFPSKTTGVGCHCLRCMEVEVLNISHSRISMGIFL